MNPNLHAIDRDSPRQEASTPVGPASAPNAHAADVTLRPMVPADLPRALSLWRRTPGVGLSPEETEPMLTAFLARNPGLSAVVCAPGDELVGAVLCGHDGRRGHRYHLAVEPAWRGRGLGRVLVDHCRDSLLVAGIRKAAIVVYTHNAEGLAFWLRSGWSSRADLTLLQAALPSD